MAGAAKCLSRKFGTLHCLSGVNKQDGITQKRMQVVLDKLHLIFFQKFKEVLGLHLLCFGKNSIKA